MIASTTNAGFSSDATRIRAKGTELTDDFQMVAVTPVWLLSTLPAASVEKSNSNSPHSMRRAAPALVTVIVVLKPGLSGEKKISFPVVVETSHM